MHLLINTVANTKFIKPHFYSTTFYYFVFFSCTVTTNTIFADATQGFDGSAAVAGGEHMSKGPAFDMFTIQGETTIVFSCTIQFCTDAADAACAAAVSCISRILSSFDIILGKQMSSDTLAASVGQC